MASTSGAGILSLRLARGYCQIKGVLGSPSSGWGCGRIGFFLPVVLVDQPASGQGDEQQRYNPKLSRRLLDTSAGAKSNLRGTLKVPIDACINIAIRRLPFALLKTHVMTMATAIAKMTNLPICLISRMPLPPEDSTQDGPMNSGRCHATAQAPAGSPRECRGPRLAPTGRLSARSTGREGRKHPPPTGQCWR
jgi:hypothetical protein